MLRLILIPILALIPIHFPIPIIVLEAAGAHLKCSLGSGGRASFDTGEGGARFIGNSPWCWAAA